MQNFRQILKGHNRRVQDEFIKQRKEQEAFLEYCSRPRKKDRPKRAKTPDCNCNSTHPGPLNGKCNVQKVIYKASIEVNGVESWYYIGQAKNFKERWANHLACFRDRNISQYWI